MQLRFHKIKLFTALSMLLTAPLLAQTNETITLITEEVISGDIQYNDITGFLFHMNGNDRKRINIDSVKSFQILDEESRHTRTFKSISYRGTSGKVSEGLFEILKETNSLSLVTMMGPLNFTQYQRTIQGGAYDYSPPNSIEIRSRTSQQETIYIRDSRGVLYPYLLIQYKVDLDDVSRSRSKTKKISEKDLLKELLTEPQFTALKAHARQKHLSFIRKRDLVKIWEYYDKINN